MGITETSRIVIEDCARLSHAGEIGFGEVVARLMASGVESYLADYRRGETIYYLPSGATHTVRLVTPDMAVAGEFDATAVQAAVRGAQSGAVKYREFMRLTMAAGCVGYFVWIAGRHVSYLGRRGESHIERFPAAN